VVKEVVAAVAIVVVVGAQAQAQEREPGDEGVGAATVQSVGTPDVQGVGSPGVESVSAPVVEGSSVPGVEVVGAQTAAPAPEPGASVGAQVPSPEARAAEAVRLRGQIVIMQTALVQAVVTGANRLLTQLSRATQSEPSSILLGQPQADGFSLPPYGVVFTVKVPGMSGVFLYALPWVIEQRRARPVRPPLAETVGGSVFADPTPIPAEMRDPNAAYVNAIKAALVDAMLENSSALRIPLDKNLTVVARQDAQPNPLDPTDAVRTMTFTVKGRDLEAFHRGRVTLEEARKLVEISVD
jgi:hypothetical protein